jgi:hypothetical protein
MLALPSLYLAMRMLKVTFEQDCGLPLSFFFHRPISRFLGLIILSSLFSYDDLLALGQLSLTWLNQDLLPLELDHVHVNLERIFIELHLGILANFNRPSFMAD